MYIEEEEGTTIDEYNEEGIPLDVEFELYDLDNNELIEAWEIREVDEHLDGTSWFDTVESIMSEMWETADQDEDGVIDFDEFGEFYHTMAWMNDVDALDDDNLTTIFTILADGEEGISHTNAIRATRLVFNKGLNGLQEELGI